MVGVEVGMQVSCLRVEIEQTGKDLALRSMRLNLIHRTHPVARIKALAYFPEPEPSTVVLSNMHDFAFIIVNRNSFFVGPEVESIHRLIVFSDVVIALG